MDDLGILCTSTSVMTSMGPNVNDTSDAITSDRPAVKARPSMPPMPGWSTDDSCAIVTFVGGTSRGEEVAAARRHVTERFAIEADPVPKEDKGQPCDERQSRLECHRYRGIEPRGGPQATDRETVRTTRSKWCTRRKLQLDTSMVDLRRITSFSFGTSLRTPMKQRSWAMMDSCQTRQHKSVGRWTFIRETMTQSMTTRLEGVGHCAPRNAVRWNHCGPIQATSTRSTESCDMEPSTTALKNTTVVLLVRTLGVGMADGGGS